MNEDLNSLIEDLVAKGATDDEIDIIVRDYQSNQSPVEPEPKEPNKWAVLGNAIKAASPLVKSAYDFGRTIYSGFTDTVPQTIEQFGEVAESAMTSPTLRDYINNNLSHEFQNYVRKREPEYSGLGGVFTSFKGVDYYADKYGKEFMESRGLGDKIDLFEAKLPEVVQRRKDLEAYVATQKQEAQHKLEGVVQDFRDIDIKSPADLGSFIAGMAGQAAYQIPLSVATRGGSSFIMESATVYDKQVDRIADETGLTREEVIEQNLDSPAAGQAWAILAGAMDAASAGKVLGAFRKKGGTILKKFLTQQTEGVTEATQGAMEDLGAGRKLDYLTANEQLATRANEYLGGVIGGSFGFFGKSSQKEVADAAIKEAATGDASIDGQIDAVAALTPQEEEILKTKRAEENLEEIKIAEEKLSKEKENLEAKLTKIEEKEAEGKESTESKAEIQEQLEAITGSQKEAESVTTNEETVTKEEKPGKDSPEYRAAVAKVEELQKKFSELPIEENADELIFELRQARQELQKIAGQPKGRGKTDIQKQIEDTTGVTREKSVKMTPAKQTEYEIKAIDFGVKLGRDLTQEQVVSKITEAAKAAKLSPRQVQSLAKRAENVSLTDESIAKFNDYVQKIVGDATYTERVEEARQLRSKIKSKLKTASPPETVALKRFLQVDPEETSIDDYLKAGTEITNSFKSPTDKAFKALNLKRVNDFTESKVSEVFAKEFPDDTSELTSDEKLSQINAKRVAERQQLQNERLRKKLEKDFTPEEVNSFMEILADESDIDATITDLNKKEKVRQVFKQLADSRQQSLPDSIEGISDEQKSVLDAMKSSNLSELSAEQLKLYIKLADRITENGDFGGAGILPVILKAQQEFKKLESAGFNILGITNWELEVSANLPAVFRALTGLPTDAAKFQLYLGIKGINDAAARSKDASESFVTSMNEMHKRFEKLYGSQRNGFTSDSIFRQGIVAELIKYDPTIDPNEALELNKKAVQASINTHKNNKEDKEAAVFARLFKPFENAKTIDEVLQIMERIDPAGKKVLDFIIDFMKPYGQKVEDSSLLYYNKPSQRLANYAGESLWVKVGERAEETVDQSDLQDIDSPGFYSKISNPKQDRSQLKFKREIPTGKVLDFNLHHKVNRQVQRVHFKTEALPYMLQVREMAKKDARMRAILGSDRLYKALFDPNHGSYFRFENNLLNKAPIPTDFDRKLRSVLNVLRKWGYNIRLGGLTQWVKQPMVLINTAIQAGVGNTQRALNEIWADKEGYRKFVYGETVSQRSHAKSLWQIGDSHISSLSSGLKNDINKAMTEGLPKYVEAAFENNFSGIGALLRADAFAANPSYLAFYISHLEKLGIKYEGFKKETDLRNTPERQEARAVAKQMLDDLQVPSNPAEMTAKIQYDKDYKSMALRNILFPFGGFSTGMKQRLVSDWRAITTGNEAQRRYAAKDVGAALAESVGFQLANQFVIGGLYHAIGEAYEWLLDMPDDDDEEKYKKWWQYTWAGVLLDNVPLILTAPGESLLVDGINYIGYELYNLGRETPLTPKEYAQEVGQPLQKFTRPAESTLEAIANVLGPIGAPLQVTIQLFDRFFEDTESLTDEQKRLGVILSMMQFGNATGFWPSDLTGATRREYFEQKKMSKVAGASGGVESSFSEDSPEVILPDLPELQELPELPELDPAQ